MNISEAGLALIRAFEGFSAQVYRCPAGYDTIGYGHRVRAGESFPSPISEAAARELLQFDVSFCEKAIRACVLVALSQGQFDALASFIYNLGSQRFEKSTLLKLLNQNKPAEAAEQFDRWIYVKGEPLEGLKRRRAAEKLMFLGEIA